MAKAMPSKPTRAFAELFLYKKSFLEDSKHTVVSLQQCPISNKKILYYHVGRSVVPSPKLGRLASLGQQSQFANHTFF